MSENRVPAQSPVFGLRVVNRDCLRPQGFPPEQLRAVYAGLTNSAHGFDMLMESATFDEIDSYYNPGEEEVSPDFILEAIVVERFSQTERRMSAVVRVLNRFLSGSEISALTPVVGKPRKRGAYAYVTVQLPFSDGQTVSVIFHSPEGDKKKIAPNDTIIAFQWLLNRRDITHVVAPENGAEISLDELSKKITQLVVKNSARFERLQKDATEERKMLEDTRNAVDDAEDSQRELMSAIVTATSESETVDAKLSNTLALLEKQKTINAELQAKLEALEKMKMNGGGGKLVRDEEHYSNKILSALVEKFGWYRDGMEFVKKAVGGGTTGGELNPTGKRIVSANFDSEKHRWLSMYSGFDKIMDIDGRPALSGKKEDVLAVARDFDSLVMEWARKTAYGNTDIGSDTSPVLELPVTAFRPEEIRVMPNGGMYLVQTRRGDGEWITQKEHSTKESAIKDAQDWYPDPSAGEETNIDNLSAVITTIPTPFPGRSAPWVVMNAPRPIRGHETQEGEFIHGRFFAAIDTSKDDASAMIEENSKLDAKIIESVDMDTAINIGLSQIPESYRDATEKMLTDADKTDSAVDMLLDKIPSVITHRKASEIIKKAHSMPSPLKVMQHQSEPHFITTLRDILAGKHDGDTARIGSLLDTAAEEAEKAGMMDENEALFNQAADHLTAMLKKRAA